MPNLSRESHQQGVIRVKPLSPEEQQKKNNKKKEVEERGRRKVEDEKRKKKKKKKQKAHKFRNIDVRPCIKSKFPTFIERQDLERFFESHLGGDAAEQATGEEMVPKARRFLLFFCGCVLTRTRLFSVHI